MAYDTLFQNFIDSLRRLHLNASFCRVGISVLSLHIANRVIKNLLHIAVLFPLLFKLQSELHHDLISQFLLLHLVFLLHDNHDCLLAVMMLDVRYGASKP